MLLGQLTLSRPADLPEDMPALWFYARVGFRPTAVGNDNLSTSRLA